MFDKLKQLNKLRELQKALGKEQLEVEKDGVKVTLNGKMEVENIKLNPEMEQLRQERALKDCINDAVRKMQIRVAQKMQQMPGFNF